MCVNVIRVSSPYPVYLAECHKYCFLCLVLVCCTRDSGPSACYFLTTVFTQRMRDFNYTESHSRKVLFHIKYISCYTILKIRWDFFTLFLFLFRILLCWRKLHRLQLYFPQVNYIHVYLFLCTSSGVISFKSYCVHIYTYVFCRMRKFQITVRIYFPKTTQDNAIYNLTWQTCNIQYKLKFLVYILSASQNEYWNAIRWSCHISVIQLPSLKISYFIMWKS